MPYASQGIPEPQDGPPALSASLSIPERRRAGGSLAAGMILASWVGLSACRSGTPDRPVDPAGGGREIILRVIEDQGIDREGALVSGGIPFSRGAVRDAAHLRVLDVQGRPVPTQAHALGLRWPDESIRWALVQFPAMVPANHESRYRLVIEAAPAPEVAPRLAIAEAETEIVVDTGELRLVFDRTPAAPGRWSAFPARIERRDAEGWETVMAERPHIRFRADREHMTREAFAETGHPPNTLWSFGLGGIPGGGRIWQRYAEPFSVETHDWSDRIERGIDYSGFFSGPVIFEVEERGPVRAVIHFRRDGEGQEGEIGYHGRIYVQAGAPELRIELTVENFEENPTVPVGDGRDLRITNTKHIRDFQIRFRPAFGAERVAYGLDGASVAVDAGAPSRLLQQAFDGASLAAGDGTAREGNAGNGWISVAGADRSLTLAGRFFREIYPKALGFEDGEVTVDFWPSETPAPGYPFTPGRIRTYEFSIGLDPPDPAAWAAAARAPLRPYPGAAYLSSTGAATPALPVDDPDFPGFSAYVDATVERWRTRQLRHGDIQFGDQSGWSRGSTSSGYHGVGNEFFMFYLASGDPVHFRMAEAAVWHDIDIDRSHWGQTAGEHQKQHNREHNHITAVPLGGIASWNFGDVDYYFLTGNRRVLQPMETTIDFLLGAGGATPGTFSQKRATALPFKHMAYMFEAIGDERALAGLYPDRYPAGPWPERTDSMGEEKSRAVLDRMKAMNDVIAAAYEERERGTAFQQSSFQSSYPPEAFYRFWALTGDRRAAEGVMLSAAYLYHEYIHPTGVPVFRDYAPRVEDGGHLAVHRWMPFVDETDLPAARAYLVSGDPVWLEYAKASLDWRVRIFGEAQRYNGFGSTIPTTLWFMKEAGMTQADWTRMRKDLDYDAALAEIDAVIPDLPERYAGWMLCEGARVLINLGRFDEAEAWLDRVPEPDREPHPDLRRWLAERRAAAEGREP